MKKKKNNEKTKQNKLNNAEGITIKTLLIDILLKDIGHGQTEFSKPIT